MGLKATILDLMTELRTIQWTTPDGVTGNLFVGIWNNQLEYLLDGKLEAIPFPACFVETIANQDQHMAVGQGVTTFDPVFRIHLLHQFYNTEGSFEENTEVFDLRDSVVRKLNRFKPLMCGPFDKISEEPDYQHGNVYHYIISYRTKFTDFTGSDQDEDTGVFTVSVPPLYPIINVNKGADYYKINSVFETDVEPMCNGGVTQFVGRVTFNTNEFFGVGTIIHLDFTSNGTITGSSSSGDGYTYNSGTKQITITDPELFLSAQIIVLVSNNLCSSVRTLSMVVTAFSGLIHHGTVGTQQTLSQTYTP